MVNGAKDDMNFLERGHVILTLKVSLMIFFNKEIQQVSPLREQKYNNYKLYNFLLKKRRHPVLEGRNSKNLLKRLLGQKQMGANKMHFVLGDIAYADQKQNIRERKLTVGEGKSNKKE